MQTESNNSLFSKSKWSSALTRKKTEPTDGGSSESKLSRVLGLWSLVALGVGATLGLGVYTLAGLTAKEQSGPAVTISFLIAAIASAFAGLCYAEFASRVPKAGSAYVYCYVTIGEFTAFVIGWNLILEYAIGTAAVAKAMSDYVDALVGNVIQNTLKDLFPIEISFLAKYPDFFAFSIVLIITLLLAWGVKESSTVNNIFTVVNLLTVLTVIIAGAWKANPKFWTIKKENIPVDVKGGNGGFIPFGWSGIMAGAARCFFGFVGFDIIATTGEEAKDPKRNIPLSIVISLLIIFFGYFGVSVVLTMLLPYYDQKANVASTFKEAGLSGLFLVISIGAICALCASLLGAIFPLPRVLYAMSEDGLLFKSLAVVNESTKTPVLATLISGILSGIVSGIFDLNQLIDMMSIGTLLAYTIVALCVLILRYKEDAEIYKQSQNSVSESSETSSITHFLEVVFNLNKAKHPTSYSQKMALYSVLSFSVFVTMLCFTITYRVKCGDIFFPLVMVFSTLCCLSFAILAKQPQADVNNIAFQVPLVPLIPLLSIAMNAYLMSSLDFATWIRFVIWLAIGFVIYFCYSLQNSVEGLKNKAIEKQSTNSTQTVSWNSE